MSEGAEHRVHYDRAGHCAIKSTLPNRFGHSTYGSGWAATPLEYLQRLAWHNHIFGDAIAILGIIRGEDYLEVITSQPWITTHSLRGQPFPEELEAYFLESGFERLPIYPNAFYSPGLRLVALDAHEANVLRDENEQLSPIDLVIGEPGPDFAREIAAARRPR